MAKTIGIDLGTTNSVMFHMHTEPEVILNNRNQRLTPSAVALSQSRKTGARSLLVGELAWNQALMPNTPFLYSTKRLMGRGFDDAEVQKMLKGGVKEIEYEIVPSPEGKDDVVRVRLGDDLLTPTEVAAIVLGQMKRDAEARLGDEVDSAVITVPAYFSERQKFATREAGALAGLKVKRIIDEPTAAAIAYGINQKDDKDRLVLVFDLGGGTFDVSILLALGGVFTQLNIEGDMWLGGDDFDNLILREVVATAEKENGMNNLSSNIPLMVDLRSKGRQAKEALSSQESTLIMSNALLDETGLPVPVEHEITRKEFEALLRPQVERAMSIVGKALVGANLEKDNIDVVLMVGGSSTIPAFQKAMDAFFGREKVQRNIDPMTCVAEGAAILAKSLADMDCPACGKPNSLSSDHCEHCGADLAARKEAAPVQETGGITGHPMGIGIKGGEFVTIIPKGTPYPTDEPFVREFHTSVPDQTIIKIPVLQGFSEKAAENDLEGNIWFYDLPPGLPANTPILVSISVDENMILTIGCQVRGTDWLRERVLQHGGWQNPCLEEAMAAQVEIKQGAVAGGRAGQMEAHVRGVMQAVEGGDAAKGKEHAAALQRMRAEKPVEEPAAAKGVDWETGLRNLLELGKTNMDRVSQFLPEDEGNVKAGRRWLVDAERALKDKDATRGRELMDNGIKVLLSVPLVGDLIAATILVFRLQDLKPSLAARLDQAKQELLDVLDRQDTGNLPQVLAGFKKVLMEAFGALSSAGGATDLPDIETLLGR